MNGRRAAITAAAILCASAWTGCGESDQEPAAAATACSKPADVVVAGPFCFNLRGLEARLKVNCETTVDSLADGAPLPVAARRCETAGGSGFDAVVYRSAREAQSAHRKIIDEAGLGDTASTWALVYNVVALTRENREMYRAVRSLRNRPKTRLRVVVRPEGPGGTVRRRTVVCDATTVRDVCERLLGAGTAIFAEGPADQACTQIYGGPATATIDGVLEGEAVRARLDRSDGCAIERWDRLEFLLE